MKHSHSSMKVHEMMSFWVHINSSITTLKIQKLIQGVNKSFVLTHHRGRIINRKIILNLEPDCLILSTADNETTNETDNSRLTD